MHTAVNGRPTFSSMVQMILGKISAVVLAASVFVSFSRTRMDVNTELGTKDIGCTNINPIVQVRIKL